MLLDALERADDECETLQEYRIKANEAEKKAAILEEKIKPIKKIEIFFGVGVGLGGAILGLTPFFWGINHLAGIIAAFIGVLMIIGSTIARGI